MLTHIFVKFISKSAASSFAEEGPRIFIRLTVSRCRRGAFKSSESVDTFGTTVLYAPHVMYGILSFARKRGKERDVYPPYIRMHICIRGGQRARGSLRNPESNISMFSNQ